LQNWNNKLLNWKVKKGELKKRGEKIAKLEQQNSELESKKGQANTKISELTNKISNLEHDRVEGEEMRHQLETELIKTRKVADSKQEVYVELADKEKEVNDLMEKHAALETEHEMIKVDVQMKKDEIIQLKKLGESKLELTDALQKLDVSLKKIEEKDRLISDLQSKIDELELVNGESDQMINSQTREMRFQV